MHSSIDVEERIHNNKFTIFDLGQEDSIFFLYYNVRLAIRIEEDDFRYKLPE
jgi:hypothetical protein